MDLQKIMDKEWQNVRKSFYYPQLPHPQLTEDVPNAQIDFTNLQIKINSAYVKELAQKGSPEATTLNAFLAHEVGHFVEYPGSVLQLLRLHKTARESLSEEEALSAREAFVNIQNNTHLVQNMGYESVPVALKAEAPGVEGLHKIVYGLYGKLWEKDLGVDLKRKERSVVETLQNIPYLDKEKQEESLKEFISATKEYLKDSKPQNPSTLSGFSDDQLREGMRQFAQESSPGEFEKLMQEVLQELQTSGRGEDEGKEQETHLKSTGVAQGVISIAKNFYSALAENFSIPIRRKQMEKNGALYPHSHEGFSIDDPVTDLDPFSSPGIIPGVTQKWIKKEGEVTTSYHGIPNNLLVIDSSGSMPNPGEGISIPVLGGTVIANAYLNNRSMVTVYNFSGSDMIFGPSRDKARLHEIIRTYQNGGTTFNREILEDIVRKQEQVDISIISDMDISNLGNFVDSLVDLPSVHRVHLLYTNAGSQEHVQGIAGKLKHKDSVVIMPLYSQEDIKPLIMGELKKSIK